MVEKLNNGRIKLREIIRNSSKFLSRRQTSIFSAATILAVSFSASALLGILRDRFLYAKFYACCTSQLDAYNAAFRIPDIVFRLLVIGALSAAFIPVFSEQLARSKKEAYKTASSVINILFILFTVLSVLIFIFSHPLSGLIAGGFDQEQILLMSRLTRLMIVAQIFFLLSNFATSMLQSYQRFLVPSFSPIVYNLGIIFGIVFLSKHLGIFGPAVGMVIGAALHFFVQLPLLLKLGFRYFFIASFDLPGVKKILRLMPPRTLALGLGEIEATILLFLASNLATGTLSLFYLGQRLTQFFSRLFGVTIGQASLPVLSKEVGNNRMDIFYKILFNSLLQASYLAFFAATTFLVLRVPIVRLAYGAAKFPWQATLTTSRVVAFFAPLVVFNTFVDILTRGFYALQDTKTPLLIFLFSLISDVAIAVLLVFKLDVGIYGLAIAGTLAAMIQSMTLTILMVKKMRSDNYSISLLTPISKMIFSGLVAGAVSWFLQRTLDQYVFDTTRIIGLIALTLISLVGGALSYLFISLLLKSTEARAIIMVLKRILTFRPKQKIPITELPPALD